MNMAIIASERPGVFSSYQTSTITNGGTEGGAVGLVAACGGCEIGRVYSVTRMSSASLYFGEDENSLMIALCEILLLNGASEIRAVAVENEQSYEQAFAILEGDETVTSVVCDSDSEAIHILLSESVGRASANKRERVGVVFAAENAGERAKRLNSERMVMVSQSGLSGAGEVLPGIFLAAALAAQVSAGGAGKNYNGLRLSGLTQLGEALGEDEVDEWIRTGVTPLEAISGGVEVIRAVTTRSESGGVPDRTYRDLSTVLVIDNVIRAVRGALHPVLSGARNNQRTRTALATQAAVVLVERQGAGLIDGYDAPRVYPDPDDGGICILELAFTVARGINQIHITAHIRV